MNFMKISSGTDLLQEREQFSTSKFHIYLTICVKLDTESVPRTVTAEM